MLGKEEDKPGSSSAADMADLEEESGPEEDVDAEALDLMGQGKRNLVVGDPPAAVQCFQEACELLASKYGETAEECGDAYYQYGCSLLELASMENGVLGNALQGVPDDSADSADSDEEGEQKPSGSNVESADKLEAKEREEVAQQVKDALEANCESEESEKEDKGKEGEGGEDEEEDEKMEEGGDNKDAEAAEKGEDEKKDEEKDVKKEEMKEEEKKEEIKEEEKKDEEKVVEEKDAKKEESKTKQEEEKEEKKDEEKSDEKETDKKDTEKVDKDDTVKTEKKEEEGKTEKKDDDDDDDDDDEAGPSAEGDQKEDGDDISNFQLAWEMLELSRIIISKKEDEESQMKVSQIHLKLGELGLETEQYTQSVVDFKACLDIQKKYLDPESRLIAGTHYNLGLACSFDQKFDESIEHYRESKQLIEKRLASLEKKVSETEGKGKEKADEKDPIVCAQKEIDELGELLPDIVSKLEDAKEMKLQAVPSDGAGPSSSTSSSGFASSSSAFAPSSSGFASSSSAFAPSSSTEPIQQIAVKKADSAPVDISHLVRKKRKPEETDVAADPKRSRQEENGEKPAVNGSGDSKVVNGNGHMANGDMNGDSKHSPEKPSEIKTKKLVSDGAAPAAMETS